MNQEQTAKENMWGSFKTTVSYRLCPTSPNSYLCFYMLPTKHYSLPSWGYCRALWLALCASQDES